MMSEINNTGSEQKRLQNPTEKPLSQPISRRQFLRGAAIAGAGLAAAAYLPPLRPGTASAQTPNPPTPETSPTQTPTPSKTETARAPEPDEQAIIRAIIELRIDNPDGSVQMGKGCIAIANGELFLVTARHVVTVIPSMGNLGRHIQSQAPRVTVTYGERGWSVGTTADWETTEDHYYDFPMDHGAAYLPLKTGQPGEELFKLVKYGVREKLLDPIVFAPDILREGDTVAIIRKDQPPETQIQFATITESSALKPKSFIGTQKEAWSGINVATVRDMDNQTIICPGMSGAPVLRTIVDTETGKISISNEAIGLTVAIPDMEDKDSLGGPTGEQAICSDEAYIKPETLLRDSNGAPIGPKEPPSPWSLLPSQKVEVKVIGPIQIPPPANRN